MADEEDTASWTIKNFPVKLRKRVVEAADKADGTIPDWLIPVLERALDQQALNGIIPPREQQKVELPHIDLHGLAAAGKAAVDAIRAAGGKPPANLGQNIAATASFYARAARGLGPAKSSSRGKKKVEIEGPPAVPMIGVDKAS